MYLLVVVCGLAAEVGIGVTNSALSVREAGLIRAAVRLDQPTPFSLELFGGISPSAPDAPALTDMIVALTGQATTWTRTRASAGALLTWSPRDTSALTWTGGPVGLGGVAFHWRETRLASPSAESFEAEAGGDTRSHLGLGPTLGVGFEARSSRGLRLRLSLTEQLLLLEASGPSLEPALAFDLFFQLPGAT